MFKTVYLGLIKYFGISKKNILITSKHLIEMISALHLNFEHNKKFEKNKKQNNRP